MNIVDHLTVPGMCLLLFFILLPGCTEDPQSVDAPALSGLRLNTVLGGADEEDYLRADEPRRFRFPEDHGAHPGYRSEWWYLTAELVAADGREFGVQFTLFRQALTPGPAGEGPWFTGQAYLGHLAVTDVSNRRHIEAQRFARGHPALAGVTTDPGWRVYIDDWSMTQTGQDAASGFNFRLQAAHQDARPARDFSVDLSVSQQQALVLQGERGLSMKGPGSGSYYYSMPRMSAAGQLTVGGELLQVSGLAWFDREWSTSVLAAGVAGWDWFSLQLKDGRSVMVFRLRRKSGERDAFDHGVLVAADVPRQGVVGAGDDGVRLLKPADYQLHPVRFWRDEQGVSWPVAWRLILRDKPNELDETFSIEALVDDQVMDTAVIYWEGLISVRDSAGMDVGRGYMELTGYGSGSVETQE